MPPGAPPEPADDAGQTEVTSNDLVAQLTESSDEVSRSTAEAIGYAAEKVVEDLGIDGFINEHWPMIWEKLRECEEYAKASLKFGGDMIFISMAIPLVNGIIHLGSDRRRLASTTESMSEVWKRVSMTPAPDRIPAISALTLIYIITKGWKGARKLKRDDPEKELWKRMQRRVQRLCSDKASRKAKESGPADSGDAG